MQGDLRPPGQGACDAALMTATGSGVQEDEEVLAIAISCVGRRLVLRERTAEEIEATLEALPPGTRQVGFYSYGEISPFSNRQLRPAQPDDDPHHHQ